MKKKSRSLFIVFKWVSIAFFGAFIFTVTGQLYPYSILLPAWQSQLTITIISYGYMPLLAVCLVLAADRLEDYSALSNWQRLNRTNFIKLLTNLSLIAAMGFILLVPLQIYTAMTINKQTLAQGLKTLEVAKRSLPAIEQSQTEAQLRKALQGFPGLSQQGSLQVPLEKAKSDLLASLTPQVKQLETNLRQQHIGRWQKSIVQIVFNSGISLSYAVGYSIFFQFQRRG